jgi:MFS transporter, DHA1 family, multidrug resistance protein
MRERSPGAAFAVALGAITLIGPLAIHLFLPAMPNVKAYFGTSDALAQATFSVTLIAMAVVTPVYGSLSDRYGRRPVLLSGLVLFLVGSLFSASAGTIAMLIVGRLIQAVGAGCGLTLARAIARDAYGSAALVRAIAYLTMAYTLGPMIAPPLGGVLIDALGWRSASWFALLVGAVISTLAYVVLFETRSRAEIDRRPAGVLHLYGALLRDRRFLAFVMQSGFMSFTFFALAAASPFLMKEVLGRTATEYGLYFMCIPVGYCAGNLISGRLSGRIAIEKMIMLGAVGCFVVVVAQSALIIAGYLSPLTIFIPGGLMSFSQGLSLPNAQAGAMRVRPELAGTAAGLGVFLQLFLSAASAEIYGLFADGTPLPMITISLIGACLAMATASYLFIKPGTDVVDTATVGREPAPRSPPGPPAGVDGTVRE